MEFNGWDVKAGADAILGTTLARIMQIREVEARKLAEVVLLAVQERRVESPDSRLDTDNPKV